MVKAFVLMDLQSMSYEQLMEPFAAAPLMIVWLSRIIRARAYNWWSRRGFLSITLHYYIFMVECYISIHTSHVSREHCNPKIGLFSDTKSEKWI